MRAAFTLIGGKAWTGGTNFLLNLLTLVTRHQPGRITPILFVGADTFAGDYEKFVAIPGIEIVVTPLLDAERQRVSLLKSVVLGRDAALTALFTSHGVDVVFESARFFGWSLGLPAVAWIPDMQHRRLPQFFTSGGWVKRELGFRLQSLGGRRIMVSSNDTRIACEHYYPSTRGRIGVVHFAIEPSAVASPVEARGIAQSYGLPDQFFFMPNQFWRHKNHDRVLDALAILKTRGIQTVIAASGRQNDPRDPTHFPALSKKIEMLGLEDEFRLLGMIPYPHLAQLMLASTAVINASLSEGWSTTVEEAKSLGIPLIVSNLDVHQEQLAETATYFDPLSPESIADAIAGFIPFNIEDRDAMTCAALADAERRIKDFVADFCRFVEGSVRDR
ncbi:glycosyltransferase family 4 protein [Rhizobium grahamii]|uniref:Glycosyltransferase family 4 protein n=1 Tax=Rhizobium grahamii TaxID=1120045 RepID=A0A5Q0C989_9HYPH|nr:MULTISPECIES: glycosyltransferase family 1 protein [Rhizobium]QFY62013.1 glycosyltransferase family 4 protein [Rhizobium grahamii]QRM48810.1 glycosyltransferase family 4 protein [Rhizobium sp. BG6]